MATTLSYDFIDLFREYLFENQYPENTRRAYVGDVTGFFLDTNLTQVDPLLIERQVKLWLAAHSPTWAPKTLNRKVTSLRKFLSLQGIANPLKDLRLPKTLPGQPHPLPGGKRDILAMIRSTANSEHHVLIALCGLMGLRISEALAANTSDINFATKKMMIYGKGRVVREIPISTDAWTYIGPVYTRYWLAGNGQPNARLVNLSDRTARLTITKLARNAGIPRAVSSHDLRATFATEAYAVSKDIVAVSRLLGHGDTRTTQIYVESGDAAMRAAANFNLEDED